MTIPEETLMAFADGELDAAGQAAVEQAMRQDPFIAARVARHRQLRQRLQAGLAGELTEPVPERLLSAVRGGGKVVRIADARATLTRNTETLAPPVASPAAAPRLWWRPVGTLAASVLLGVGLGYGVFRQAGLPVSRGADGALQASGLLHRALNEQLASTQPAEEAVRVGLSYLSRSGNYCRSFTLRGANAPAGIACRHGEGWQIEALATRTGGAEGAYRTAATALPPALLKIVEDQMQGETLDAAGEAAALRGHWNHAP